MVLAPTQQEELIALQEVQGIAGDGTFYYYENLGKLGFFYLEGRKLRRGQIKVHKIKKGISLLLVLSLLSEQRYLK